jgi:hypothetical protein
LLPLTLLRLFTVLSGLLSLLLLSVLSLRGSKLLIIGAASTAGDGVGSRA